MQTMAPAGAPVDGVRRQPTVPVPALQRLEWLRAEVVPPHARARTQDRPVLVALAVAVLVLAAGAGLLRRSTPVTGAGLAELAYDHQQAGRLAEAEAMYEAVVARQPGNAVAQFNLGVLHHQRGSVLDAGARYEAAVSADPTFVPALHNLAMLRRETDPVSAIDLYRRVLAIQPDHPAANRDLGVLLLERGEVVEGSALIERAVALDPTLQID